MVLPMASPHAVSFLPTRHSRRCKTVAVQHSSLASLLLGLRGAIAADAWTVKVVGQRDLSLKMLLATFLSA
jgi:hypothetical protein